MKNRSLPGYCPSFLPETATAMAQVAEIEAEVLQGAAEGELVTELAQYNTLNAVGRRKAVNRLPTVTITGSYISLLQKAVRPPDWKTHCSFLCQ